MKTNHWTRIIGILLLSFGLFKPASDFAQMLSIQSDSGIDVAQPAQLDSIVQLTADAQGLPLVPPDALPKNGTFWLVMPGINAVPMPCPPNDTSLAIYQIADGQFLVDATGGQLAASPQFTGRRMTATAVTDALAQQASAVVNLINQVQEAQFEQAMGISMDDSNSMSPDGLSSLIPDYGTNLWIAQVTVLSGNLNGIATNTQTDVEYEIQSRTNLLQTDWQSEGPIFGSETTNWTPLSVTQNGRPILFLRLRSWVDSTGSGIPDWWWLQYFGSVGGDSFAFDPSGDGLTLWQSFIDGLNPTVFNSPPAPQRLTVNYNGNNSTANISWQASPGSVTGYTVQRIFYSTLTGEQIQNFNFPSNTVSFSENVPATALDNLVYDGPNVYGTYQIQTHYGTYSSAWSSLVWLEPDLSTFATLITDRQGSAYLAASGLPSGTVAFRLTRLDNYAEFFHGDESLNTTIDIPIGSLTNGLYPLPASAYSAPKDSYGVAAYKWWLQTVNTNGNLSAAILLDSSTFIEDNANHDWLVSPCFDGRQQLKQNLIFLLRSAVVDFPFEFVELGTGQQPVGSFQCPAGYACAGLYKMQSMYGNGAYFSLDPYLPFADNNRYRNFVFSMSDIDSGGAMTTGAGGDDGLTLQDPPFYQFQPPATNWAPIPALLGTNSTRWLDSFAASYDWSEIGVTWFFDSDYNTFYAMANNTRNLFGLPFLSAKIAWGNTSDANVTLSAGGQVENVGGYFYPETAQPQFQTAEYDFWNVGTDLLPGEDGFSPANQNHLMAVSVGSSAQIAGYAKLAVANSYYTGVYGYLGQYFDQAYQINTNGTVTTSTTGVLSPYGQFFATQPGPAALVTMPDLDAGARGTCTVYCVSAVIDRSQASNMDLSFNGVDATSANNPAQIWVNNNYDRGHTVDGSDFEQDDLSPLDIGKGHLVSDCQYTANGLPAIPCTRDLEDYFRLWTPGVAALMKVLPANYTVQLTLSGNGQIRIFQAVEPNGGTNYLFDETTASNQVANSASLYVGLLTSSSPIILPIQTNFNEHFIFCGVMDGSAQIDLQILDGNQNIVADAPAYLQINEIKDMYERWTVGDRPANAPMNKPVLAGEDLSTSPPTQAFQYAPPQNPSTPYILLVHGWNMQTWEKDRYAEAAYKRLYWQGYKGRFGLFRWPTGNGFSGVISVIGDARNYDNSESNAWASATGLTNLLTQLNAEYPGHVYLMAHSMGNVVAGEALRLAGSQLVNTYVAMQGAVPAHCYDASTVNRSSSGPPDCYAAYWTNGAPCYFNGTAGAGTYVNFYNTNDFALRYWNMDQDPFKPDNSGLPFPGYYYDTPSGTHPSGFYKIIGSTDYDLYFPSSTYEIFAYADRAWSYALGAQPGVAGSFTTAKQVNLPSVWPIDTHPQINNKSYSAHVWHSAQFRSDNMSRAAFWNTVLNRMNLSP